MTMEKLNEVRKEFGYTIETVPLSFEIFRNKGIIQPFLFGKLNFQKRLREYISYVYDKQVGIARASDGTFVYFTLMFTVKDSYYISLVSARLSVTEFTGGDLVNWKKELEKQETLDATLRYDLPSVKINSLIFNMLTKSEIELFIKDLNKAIGAVVTRHLTFLATRKSSILK